MPERIKIRNTVARSALMRKGGAHVQSRSGARQQSKMAVENAIDEWRRSLLDDGEWRELDIESSAATAE